MIGELVRLLVLAALLVTAAGCSLFRGEEMSVVSATSDQATIRFRAGELDQATSRAQQLCAAHARTARLDRVTGGEGSEQIGYFSCVYGG